jgi:protein TonB
MVFEAAPAAVPAVPAAPVVAPAVVPRPPEPPLETALTSEPPAPLAPVPPPTARAPEPPAPPPVPAAATPLPVAPVHVARTVPKAPPHARTPPVERQAARHPRNEPARNLASLTPPPSSALAQPQSAVDAASRPAATGPLIPPRPVAGMETNRAPAYPEIALRRGEAGRVMLRVSVSAHGRPLEVAVAQSSGYPMLDSAALAAVREWQFIPATQAGIPVAAIADVPVRFRIDN